MVYLLCFDKKFKHAKHYIGFAENQRTFEQRMKHHAKGSGSRLMAAIAKAGITFTVARTWADGDRNFERSLKNRKSAAELCPHCKLARATRKKELALVRKNRPKLLIDTETGGLDGALQVIVTDISKPRAIAEALRQKHIEHIKTNPPSPAMQAMIDKLSEPGEFDKAFEMFRDKPEPIGLAAIKLEDGDVAVGELYAKPESDTNTSRWTRFWHCLARFWRPSETKRLS